MADVKTFVPAPDRAPPSSAVGPIAWIRDNLFGSIGSSIATLVFFYLFFSYVPLFVEWALINANWTGSDRSVCEANAAGACWTFINVRLEQILFGLYFASNPDELWRPTLIFILFFALSSAPYSEDPISQ